MAHGLAGLATAALQHRTLRNARAWNLENARRHCRIAGTFPVWPAANGFGGKKSHSQYLSFCLLICSNNLYRRDRSDFNRPLFCMSASDLIFVHGNRRDNQNSPGIERKNEESMSVWSQVTSFLNRPTEPVSTFLYFSSAEIRPRNREMF